MNLFVVFVTLVSLQPHSESFPGFGSQTKRKSKIQQQNQIYGIPGLYVCYTTCIHHEDICKISSRMTEKSDCQTSERWKR